MGNPKTASAEPKGSKKSGKGGTGAKEVAGGLTGAAANNSKATVQASKDDLESLEGRAAEPEIDQEAARQNATPKSLIFRAAFVDQFLVALAALASRL